MKKPVVERFKPFPIGHIVNLGVQFIQQVEELKKGKPGKEKRETVKKMVLEALPKVGMILNLKAEQSKQFDTAMNKVIDGVVAILNLAEETQ